MKPKEIYLGQSLIQADSKKIQGDIVTISDEKYYKISNYNMMRPFFMNIVSDSDLWMFISSNGALTAGRQNPDNALFPYYTDDRIHDSHDITGSKTILFVNKEDKLFLWEPFSSKSQGIYKIERNIYKNIIGNKIIFEEINLDLQLIFKYSWNSCDRFGFVKKSKIINNNTIPVSINILDGIQNILPSGTDRKFQLEYSTLVDGYKKNELQTDTGLGLYMMSSIPTDKAEPSESLKANIAWSTGLQNVKILLSGLQLDLFRRTTTVTQETDIKAKRGAYFLHSEFELEANQENKWCIIADINKDHKGIAQLSNRLIRPNNILSEIESNIVQSTENLKMMVAQADGNQQTSDQLNTFRHYSNTLFNIMRGGVFVSNYSIDKKDFHSFVQCANKQVAVNFETFINDINDQSDFEELIKRFSDPNPNFERLCYEYLPLTFSRRHGDPSRPWNQFSIDLRDDEGNKILNYQGNWRDIFQNWEALALSYPEYIESMIIKFVNASTADGYNPYRVTRDGFDWEVLDPADSWSYIGYWGDHQIVYLHKLLELSVKYHPGKLKSLLTKKFFTYANVPYRIKPYKEIIQDPYNTIDFDYDLDADIEKRVDVMGTDGKLVFDEHGEIYHVNLLEKLLLPMLVKFSNFIPEAGIWMNTQRPEWNDANNALVGYGTSMVTLYYLRQYVAFCLTLFEETPLDYIEISEEVFELFNKLHEGTEKFKDLLNDRISNTNRKRFLDHMCQAGSDHRQNIYENGFSGRRQSIQIKELISFLNLGKKYIDHSIKANKRDDDLYHAYNLIKFPTSNEISIRYLYEMLEGQVAVLNSGYLSFEDSIILLNSLSKSALLRKDQNSYILYPNRELPKFTEKNIIPEELLEKSSRLKTFIEQDNRDIAYKDINGHYHFNSKFRNSRILKQALNELVNKTPDMSQNELDMILEIYETVFDHQSFTGRSGTFYKYEGLGSIYWHMVSKLLLSVQDTYYRAVDLEVSQSILEKLKTYYYTIREGIGSHKNPELYGSFPTDAYSHTPQGNGAKQPGMTGQVKEDIISRFGELGVVVHDGKIRFYEGMLDKNEFHKKSQIFYYYDVENKKNSMVLNPGTLAFTFCQVSVIYIMADEPKIKITMKDGTEKEFDSQELGAAESKSIFLRKNKITKIQVLLKIEG